MSSAFPEAISIVDFCASRADDLAKLHTYLDLVEAEPVAVGGEETEGGQDPSESRSTLSAKRKRTLEKNALGKNNERRRTSSHLRYRIPVRKRLGATEASKMKKRKQDSESLRCRKHRRRPHLLLLNHRSNGVENDDGKACKMRWLESHFWNRKRLKSEEKWGWCLPIRHQNRSMKVLHKFLDDSAVIYDKSHCEVIELTGALGDIIEVLAPFLDGQATLLEQWREVVDALDSEHERDGDDSPASDGRYHAGQPEGGAVSLSALCHKLSTQLFFKRDSFPQECYGPVDAMLFPKDRQRERLDSTQSSSHGTSDSRAYSPVNRKDNEDIVGLWLWVHPSFFHDLLRELREAADEFSLTASPPPQLESSSVPSTTSIEVTAITHMNRFSIAGEQSLAILWNALRPNPYDETGVAQQAASRASEGLSRRQQEIAKKRSVSNSEYFRQFAKAAVPQGTGRPGNDTLKYWHVGSSLALNVYDPRLLSWSAKGMSTAPDDVDSSPCIGDREKTSSKSSHFGNVDNHDDIRHGMQAGTLGGKSRNQKRNARYRNALYWPPGVYNDTFELYSEAGRAAAMKRFTPDHRMNELKHTTQLVQRSADAHAAAAAGTQADAQAAAEREMTALLHVSIPVMLIRKDIGRADRQIDSDANSKTSTNLSRHSCLAWDVLAPCGWGAALWNAFQYAGAKAVGAEEWDRVHLNTGAPSFPRDYPETPAGRRHWREQREAVCAKRGKRPPNKRRFLAAHMADAVWHRLGQGYTAKASRVDLEKRSNKPSTKTVADETFSEGEAPMDCTPDDVVECDDTSKGGDVANRESQCDYVVIRQDRYFEPFVPLLLESDGESEGGEDDDDGIVNTRDAACVPLERSQSQSQGQGRHRVLLNTALPPSLPPGSPFSALLVGARVHPTARGVIHSGAVLLAPTTRDCIQWLEHRRLRKSATLSGKRLGDWHGVELLKSGSTASTHLSTHEQSGSGSSDCGDIGAGPKGPHGPPTETTQRVRDGLAAATLAYRTSRCILGQVTSGREPSADPLHPRPRGQAGSAGNRTGRHAEMAMGLVDASAMFHAYQHFWVASQVVADRVRDRERAACQADEAELQRQRERERGSCASASGGGEGGMAKRFKYRTKVDPRMLLDLDADDSEDEEKEGTVTGHDENGSDRPGVGPYRWRSVGYTLVMVHNAHSRWLRPALVQYAV